MQGSTRDKVVSWWSASASPSPYASDKLSTVGHEAGQIGRFLNGEIAGQILASTLLGPLQMHANIFLSHHGHGLDDHHSLRGWDEMIHTP